MSGARKCGTYPPIDDYAFISDSHSTALISQAGSIDWSCLPRMDSSPVFARLLDWERGGYCQIEPTDPYTVTRRYLPDTLVLETVFRTKTAQARLLDCFAMREGGKDEPYRQIIRCIEGQEGSMSITLKLNPRFDYGAIHPWIKTFGKNQLIAQGGSDGLLIGGNFPTELSDHHGATAFLSLNQGERRFLSILHRPPEVLDGGNEETPSIEELEQRLDQTIRWWKCWSAQGFSLKGEHAELARRSAIVLKGLSNAPTGAIAAAATTSLPESWESGRNWDYRFSWIRDSVYAVYSLAELGYVKEADGFRRFIQRSSAGDAKEIQPLFGLGGERRLHEYEVPELCGYAGIGPVRVGNAAENQLQLDIYGELLDLTYNWHRRGNSTNPDFWKFTVDLVNCACEIWHQPDHGFWEIRSEPRHFVQSKAMCWTAIEHGILMAQELDCDAPLETWREQREKIRLSIEENGYDPERGVFIQAYGFPSADASLLLLPMFGFVDFDDPRMVRTVELIKNELDTHGLLLRYAHGTNDGLRGDEGVFITCTFWLAECLARQGKIEEARAYFDRAANTRNDLGLFAEEFDPVRQTMMGNFPQALTHLAYIRAALAMKAIEKDETNQTTNKP